MNITYHAHVYFEPNTMMTAINVLERFTSSVTNWTNIKVGKVHEGPVGPHPKGMFMIAFTQVDFGNIVSWLMLERHGLTVLVHPETGNELADHTIHPLWMGEILPLDLTKL